MRRLVNSEIDKRVDIVLDKSILKKNEGINGLMYFGKNNDYPQKAEKLINGSITAKSTANVYSKHLSGKGFVDSSLNQIIIGKDSKGKDITLLKLLSQIAISTSRHNGFYVHCNYNLLGEVTDCHLKDFKNIRIAKPDDTGYSAKLCYYENWAKDNGPFKKEKIRFFNVFNPNIDVITTEINKSGDIKSYPGQIYFEYLDDEYFYPLSIFDPVYLDLDTENQIQLYKNRQIRNGFLPKTLFRVTPDGTEEDKKELGESIRSFMGADGDSVLILEDDIDSEGNVTDPGSFKIEKIEGNVDDKLFTNWEQGISNNIRKSAKGIPAILIDYENSKLGNTSGEALRAAQDFYNSITQNERDIISQSFAKIFANAKNKDLRNRDWSILTL